MTKQDHLLLAALKRCEAFLLAYPTLLGPIHLSPPARELKYTISVIEYCAATRAPGIISPLPLALRHGRIVRRNLDDLVRPIVRENAALAATWRRAKTIWRGGSR